MIGGIGKDNDMDFQKNHKHKMGLELYFYDIHVNLASYMPCVGGNEEFVLFLIQR